REKLARLSPVLPVELPAALGFLVVKDREGQPIFLEGSEADALERGDGKLACDPLVILGGPDSCLSNLVIRDDDVHVPVVVEIEQADSVVGAARATKGRATQEVFLDPFQRLAEVEELDSLPVLALCVANEVHVLLGAAPPVRMEDHGHDALLENGRVERRLPVFQQARIGGFLNVLPLPIARDDAGEFETGT